MFVFIYFWLSYEYKLICENMRNYEYTNKWCRDTLLFDMCTIVTFLSYWYPFIFYSMHTSTKKLCFDLSCIYVKIHIHVYTCLFLNVQYTYPYLHSVYHLSQTKGDGQRIYETDETSYHLLFQGFKNSSISNEGNTFSVSMYNDGSIRQRYHR